ncbi:MAG: sigma 54-interacting transcriptional regulator, partial [Thermoleophilia bacterium]|nr:sigma 54-interacting transcriptional regulator [Thermoleophilia bacterium]
MASSRVSGARLDQLLQNTAEPAFWLNRELKLIWVNRAWEELTGCPAAEALGMVCRAHGPTRPGDLESLAGSFFPPAEAIAGQPAGARTLILHPSGERRWRRVDYWPFRNDRGDLTAVLGLVREAEEPGVLPDSEAHRLRTELMELRHRLVVQRRPEALIGRGRAHRRLLAQVEAASASDVPVLIVGEPGTGKRHLATLIHQRSARRSAPLLPVDVGALSPEILERDLFRPGGSIVDGDDGPPRLAAPDGSTLMLRDVFDLPRDLQGRLA